MKAPIGVDAQSGRVHTVKTTTASMHDSQVFTELTHGGETALSNLYQARRALLAAT